MVVRMTHLTYNVNWINQIILFSIDVRDFQLYHWIQKWSILYCLPSSTPIIFPHELQYSANTPSKHLTQNGLPFLIMYLWPPSWAWHSAQLRWSTCHGLPSASVQFSDSINWKINGSLSLLPSLSFYFMTLIFYIKISIHTSSQAEHLGFRVSAWCLPQNNFPFVSMK